MKSYAVGISFCLLVYCATAKAGEKAMAVNFRATSFADACKAAEGEKKIVFIDFFTTWCGPCKLLDERTWTDAAVGKLLEEKSVPLKIDAEREADLARRYKIAAYPTLLLLRPDGTELDRLVGYRDPAQFSQEFTAGIQGKTGLTRAKERVAAAEGAAPADQTEVVKARYELARQLAQSGKYEDALKEYLWCYDVGMVKLPSYTGVRNSYLLSDIAALGRSYPPGVNALVERRDQAELLLKSPSAAGAVVRDYSAINHALNLDDRTLAFYDGLPPDDSRRNGLKHLVFPLLVKLRHYPEALEAKTFTQMNEEFDRFYHLPNKVGAPADAIRDKMFAQLLASNTAQNTEVLVGAGQLAQARALEERLTRVDPSPETRLLFKQAASRAGHPEALDVSNAEPAPPSNSQ